MDKADILGKLAEIKELVTQSGIDATVIGEIRMMLFLAEKEVEALETEAQWACPLCHCCGEKRHDGDDPCVSCAATRNEALEMAEKAICPLCKDGELIDTDGGHGDDEEWAPCPAEPIAALRERQG